MKRLSTENAKAFYAALVEFGAPLEGLSPVDFAEPGPFFRMGREPLGVDILTAVPGLDFDAAWQRRVEDVIDPASGLKAYFISADDLIASKLGTGRPQDIADVDAIRKKKREEIRRRPNRDPETELLLQQG